MISDSPKAAKPPLGAGMGAAGAASIASGGFGSRSGLEGGLVKRE